MNVLKKILIPKIDLTIKYILSELEELEREEVFRLKRVKEKKMKKSPVREDGAGEQIEAPEDVKELLEAKEGESTKFTEEDKPTEPTDSILEVEMESLDIEDAEVAQPKEAAEMGDLIVVLKPPDDKMETGDIFIPPPSLKTMATITEVEELIEGMFSKEDEKKIKEQNKIEQKLIEQKLIPGDNKERQVDDEPKALEQELVPGDKKVKVDKEQKLVEQAVKSDVEIDDNVNFETGEWFETSSQIEDAEKWEKESVFNKFDEYEDVLKDDHRDIEKDDDDNISSDKIPHIDKSIIHIEERALDSMKAVDTELNQIPSEDVLPLPNAELNKTPPPGTILPLPNAKLNEIAPTEDKTSQVSLSMRDVSILDHSLVDLESIDFSIDSKGKVIPSKHSTAKSSPVISTHQAQKVSFDKDVLYNRNRRNEHIDNSKETGEIAIDQTIMELNKLHDMQLKNNNITGKDTEEPETATKGSTGNFEEKIVSKKADGEMTDEIMGNCEKVARGINDLKTSTINENKADSTFDKTDSGKVIQAQTLDDSANEEMKENENLNISEILSEKVAENSINNQINDPNVDKIKKINYKIMNENEEGLANSEVNETEIIPQRDLNTMKDQITDKLVTEEVVEDENLELLKSVSQEKKENKMNSVTKVSDNGLLANSERNMSHESMNAKSFNDSLSDKNKENILVSTNIGLNMTDAVVQPNTDFDKQDISDKLVTEEVLQDETLKKEMSKSKSEEILSKISEEDDAVQNASILNTVVEDPKETKIIGGNKLKNTTVSAKFDDMKRSIDNSIAGSFYSARSDISERNNKAIDKSDIGYQEVIDLEHNKSLIEPASEEKELVSVKINDDDGLTENLDDTTRVSRSGLNNNTLVNNVLSLKDKTLSDKANDEKKETKNSRHDKPLKIYDSTENVAEGNQILPTHSNKIEHEKNSNRDDKNNINSSDSENNQPKHSKYVRNHSKRGSVLKNAQRDDPKPNERKDLKIEQKHSENEKKDSDNDKRDDKTENKSNSDTSSSEDLYYKPKRTRHRCCHAKQD